MADSDIKVGTLVCLNSGGPPMTVERINQVPYNSADCVWFEGTKPIRDRFPLAALKRSEDAEGPKTAVAAEVASK